MPTIWFLCVMRLTVPVTIWPPLSETACCVAAKAAPSLRKVVNCCPLSVNWVTKQTVTPLGQSCASSSVRPTEVPWPAWGGLMAELGSHQLDACSIFLGKVKPLAVSAVGGKYFYRDDRDAEDHVYCTFEFPGKGYWKDYALDREGTQGQESRVFTQLLCQIIGVSLVPSILTRED